MRFLTTYSLFVAVLGCGEYTSQSPDGYESESESEGERQDGGIDDAPDALIMQGSMPDANAWHVNHPDAGVSDSAPDAGADADTPDMGSDQGTVSDEGTVTWDAGTPDTGLPDSGGADVVAPDATIAPSCADPLGCWTAMSADNAPTARERHTAIWTGSEMIVWGGYRGECGSELGTGGRYDPETDAWLSMSLDSAPSPRMNHTVVWTGSEMIVWGGWTCEPITEFGDGAAYEPSTNTWAPLPVDDSPSHRFDHTAIWTGSEMIVWGGRNAAWMSDGGRYQISTGTWLSLSTTNTPYARSGHIAIWTGLCMVVWGGETWDGVPVYPVSGGRYECPNDRWDTATADATPVGRSRHTAIWTGTHMVVWGGAADTIFGDGGLYDPDADAWASMSMENAPSARMLHIAVWTGSEMLVWGGATPTITGDGGRYDPETDVWASMSSVGAPTARDSHTAIWTGSEMLVWGGGCAGGSCGDGYRYTPPSP